MGETLHIYHTNDVHSHFANWPRIRSLLKERKRWHEEAGDFCLVLDIGDHVDRSHPFTEGTSGKGNIELLNGAGYDAVTIGNNEGITLAKEELNSLYLQADFEVIVANLFDLDGSRPEWAKAFHVMETKSGIRLALVGATAEFTPFYRRLGWTVTDAKDSIVQAVETVKDQADFIICLSHLGIKEDEQLVELCPEIDVLLGAHTHHIFHEGKVIGDTLLGAAGKFGMYIGHIAVDLETGAKEADLIETALLQSVEEDFDDLLIAQGKEQLNDPIFYNEQVLDADWFRDSKLAEMFGEAMIEFSGADCAIFNAGLFMENMPLGTATRYDFHKMLPHPINPCLIELTGAELKEIYLQSLNADWPKIELKGMGFRGAVFGKMIRINLSMENRQLFIGEIPANPDQTYKLITLDMFTFGYFFPSLKRAPKKYFMPEFLRDVFSQYFRSKTLK
ncbi:Trifunctional nucleotide phosphoesterase protein YfkN precursor [Planococcus massiliensis]|uniref:Trifunctional nucleotide phosphoesterase protein YfkN n=1 Tax=Planococcus massiliensis TaxID=1499687 RepID=A0A098EM28_9BACL|nr:MULTISPECIES: bifunctional metallophosphatase/5'-nucleotidase [Planococcus]MCJ1909164.1 5'-nucleotidase C-terminal domain-containing protein [Planococcus ruber]CEG23379.1 Trifunctional nucleotide phosphoesterase protein YfkN precursor [Planococcus massiliensis]